MKRKTILLLVIFTVLVVPFSRIFGADNEANLEAVKTYLLGKATDLADGSKVLTESTDAYYELAKAANFDYAQLWKSKQDDVKAALEAAKKQWIVISPYYEQMEGIVAGVPSLSNFDAI